jgi:DNA-binding MarR family transcriptional regulator
MKDRKDSRVTAGLDEPRWLDDSEQESWRAYLRGSRYLEEALDRDLQTHGLQLTEYEILSMLSESDGGRLRMSELADLVVQSRSRLTHTAARLEKRGWVERQSCLSDRRGVELVLTDEGWARLTEMAKAHVDSVRRHLLDVMTPEEFAALGSAMAKVRDAALGIHQAVVAEACAEAELEEALDQELARADS